MDQALNSQKTPHTSPLRASYGMSFVSILMKNDRVIKGFYCIKIQISQIHVYQLLNYLRKLKISEIRINDIKLRTTDIFDIVLHINKIYWFVISLIVSLRYYKFN